MTITEDDYYWALSISPDNDYEIHLKRSTGFVNNYDPILLKAWETNVDLQPVHNYFKALTYMTAYFWKSESELSESLKQASKEIKNQNLNVCDVMQWKIYRIHL